MRISFVKKGRNRCTLVDRHLVNFYTLWHVDVVRHTYVLVLAQGRSALPCLADLLKAMYCNCFAPILCQKLAKLVHATFDFFLIHDRQHGVRDVSQIFQEDSVMG
jgi:hypothetical protein